MKKILFIFLLSFALFVGCDKYEEIQVDEGVAKEISSVTLGNKEYALEYKSYNVSSFNRRVTYQYAVKNSANTFASVTINLDNGKVVSFVNIFPYEPIEDPKLLSDEEIKDAAQKAIAGDFDLARYNAFEVTRYEQNGNCLLKWYVMREMECDISLILSIDSEGRICDLSVSDDCPEGTKPPYSNEKEKKRLLEKAILKEMGLSSLRGYSYEIRTEVLTEYKGNGAVIFTVKVEDEKGFGPLIAVAVK